MPSNTNNIAEPTQYSIKTRFYVALQYPLASEAEMLQHMEAHLSYMIEHENKVFSLARL